MNAFKAEFATWILDIDAPVGHRITLAQCDGDLDFKHLCVVAHGDLVPIEV